MSDFFTPGGIAYSTGDGEWDTPRDMVQNLSRVFDFDVDVCATKENAVCQNFYDRERDGLSQQWCGLYWMNPPYGREIPMWMENMLHSPGTGVCLLPARVGTRWWQRSMVKATHITFIQGRLKYGSDASWIARYNTTILKAAGITKTETRIKKLRAVVKKLGGYHCMDELLAVVKANWKSLGMKMEFDAWGVSSYLHPDPAPFDSALVVFGGKVTVLQATVLAQYGWTPLWGGM